MQCSPQLTRRRFLGVTAAGVWMAGKSSGASQSATDWPDVAWTDHFWYRPQPEGIFPEARHIVFSGILQNGNILFSALAKLYLSTDNLRTYRQITVRNADGSDYLPHTPQNPAT